MTDAPTEHTRCPVCGLVVPEADLVTSEEIVGPDIQLDVSDLQKKYPGLGECGIRTVHVHVDGCRRCLETEAVQ